MLYIKYHIVYLFLLITNGILMICWRRCGIIYNLLECKSEIIKQLNNICNNFLKAIYITLFNSYTKPKGQLPDYNSPVVLNTERRTVEDFCNKLHRSIAKEFK